MDLIGGLELSWLEAAVLLHHHYRDLELEYVADIVDRRVDEVAAAGESLIRKAAVALGYVTPEEAGVKVAYLPEVNEAAIRRQMARELRSQGLSLREIARRLGVSHKMVMKYLAAS